MRQQDNFLFPTYIRIPVRGAMIHVLTNLTFRAGWALARIARPRSELPLLWQNHLSREGAVLVGAAAEARTFQPESFPPAR